MTLSLRQKINLAILVTFVFIAVIFTAVQLPFQRHRLAFETDNVKLLLKTLVQRDEEELANEIFDDRIKALEIRLEEISRLDGIICTCVFNTAGTRLASTAGHSSDLSITPETLSDIEKYPRITRFGPENQPVLIFSKSLSFLGEYTGFILIHYSLDKLIENQKMSVMIFAGLLTATLLTMLLVLNLILSRAILAPLLHLKDGSKAIVQGDYDTAVRMSQNDEIGQLSESFDRMRLAVKDKIGDIEQMKETYRQLYHQAPAMLCSVDRSGRIVEVNHLLTDTLGFPRDQLVGSRSFDFLLTEEPARITPFLEKNLASSNTVTSKPYKIRTKDNRILDTLVSVFAQKDPKGKILQATLSIQDITEKIQAETALRRREQQLRLLTDNMVDVISQTDPDLNLVYLSPSAERVFGVPPEELIGRSALPFIHPDDVETILKKASKAREDKQESLRIEYRWRHANGDYLWVESAIRLLYDPAGSSGGAIYGTRDITENKKATREKEKLERQLIQSQKIEAIGTLAGGIAHDFNNMLSGIFGFTQLAKNSLKNPDQAAKHIDNVFNMAQKAAELVRQILTFSQKTNEQKVLLPIHIIVKEALQLLRASIPSTIEIKETILSKAAVMANPTNIHQIIMNLGTNAYHAMEKHGGILAVTLKEIAFSPQDTIQNGSIPPGRYLKLEVSDNGSGMDQATVMKIFEPYFTTKKPGKGTGLGLSVVMGIVEDHKGHIKVYSEPGQGTTFHIFLPIVDRTADFTPIELKEDAAGIKGTERILMVDDENAILLSSKTLLEKMGYRVTVFSNGPEALEAYEQTPEQFDIVITDMTMPAMTGADLAGRILRLRPDQKIILCTGHSELINKEKAEAMGISAYVEKPIIIKELARQIRQTLDRQHP